MQPPTRCSISVTQPNVITLKCDHNLHRHIHRDGLGNTFRCSKCEMWVCDIPLDGWDGVVWCEQYEGCPVCNLNYFLEH